MLTSRLQGGVLTSAGCGRIGLPQSALVAHYQDGAVGVADHGVGDAAHKSTSYSAQAPATHNYQAGSQLLAQMDDLPVRPPPDQVGVRHGYPFSLDLLHLPIQ